MQNKNRLKKREEGDRQPVKTFIVLGVIFSALLLFSFSLVSAQPPFDEQISGGLTIEFSKIDIIQQNTAHHFHFHVFNSTRFKDNTTTQCGLTIVDSYGDRTYKNAKIDYHAGSENEWGINLIGTNFSSLGQYSCVVECNSTTEVGFTSFGFEVTPDGLDNTTMFYIIILILSAGVIIFGYYIQDATVILLGSFGLYFVGLYILFNGVDGFKDPVYTWAIGIIVLMLAVYFSIKAALETIVD